MKSKWKSRREFSSTAFGNDIMKKHFSDIALKKIGLPSVIKLQGLAAELLRESFEEASCMQLM